MSDDPYEASRRIILSFGDIANALKRDRFSSSNESVMYTGTLMKLWQHGLSSLKLCEEPFNERFPHQRDYASPSVIGRAVIESAGLFKYLFFSDISDDERQFILDYTEMRGVMVQTKYEPSSPELRDKYLDKCRRVEELKTDLQSHARYQALNRDQRKNFRKGRYEPFTKSSLPEKLGFGPRAARYYSYLSDYTHNGYVAALQVSQPDKAQMMARASLQPIALAFSYLISAFYSQLPEVRGIVDSDEALKTAVYNFTIWGNESVLPSTSDEPLEE